MKSLKELQAKFDLCVMASPTSWGGSFSRNVPQLVNSRSKTNSATATITYMVIPEVSRGFANIRNYLETNCLLRNPLGQYVISEAKLTEALKRIDAINENIQKAVDGILNNYDTLKSDFQAEMSEYLAKHLGVRQSKKVLSDVMNGYPTRNDICAAAVSLRLDYVYGSNGLSEDTIKAVDESKAIELAQAYQDMVRRAIEPVYQKLGQLINQAIEDKMSERTMTAYRHSINRMKEDNAILSNPTLDSIATCSFMALNNSDYAEMLMTCIYRLAKNAGVESKLPEIPRYDSRLLNELADDDGMPTIEEMVSRAKKVLDEEEEE